jgi:hypothetical protein
LIKSAQKQRQKVKIAEALKEEIMLAEVVAARQDLKNIIKIVLSDSLGIIIVVAMVARPKNGIRHLSRLPD